MQTLHPIKATPQPSAPPTLSVPIYLPTGFQVAPNRVRTRMTEDRHETLFEALGGEEPIRKITDRFYDFMDSLPQAASVRAMHPQDLTTSRDKFFWFLVGWMGGPDLFVQRFGHPRLRARHLPFKIDSRARDQWMLCMTKTLEIETPDETIRTQLLAAFSGLANHMRNTANSDLPNKGLPLCI